MVTLRLIGCGLIFSGATALDLALAREARARPARIAETLATLGRLREQIVGYGRPPDEAARRVSPDCGDLASLCDVLAAPLPDEAADALRDLPSRLAAIDCDRVALFAGQSENLRAVAASARDGLGERLRLIHLACFGGAAAVILLLW